MGLSSGVVLSDTVDNLSSQLFRRKVVNMSRKLGSVFQVYQGRSGNCKSTWPSVANQTIVKAVQEHRHRCGALDRLGNAVGRVFQTEMLLAIVVRHLDRPTKRKDREDFLRRQTHISAVT